MLNDLLSGTFGVSGQRVWYQIIDKLLYDVLKDLLLIDTLFVKLINDLINCLSAYTLFKT